MEFYRGPVPAAWASWTNTVLGVYEIAAPWIWGYPPASDATVNSVIVGGLIVFAASTAALSRVAWPSWWNVGFGAWLIIAPFVLGYAGRIPKARSNDIAVGIAVLILALIAALSKPGRITGLTPPPEE